MKLVQAFILAVLCCALALSVHQAAECVINFVSHGTFRSISTPEGTCLQFVDDLGTPWEITNPRGSWKDGLTGTVIADSSAYVALGYRINRILHLRSRTIHRHIGVARGCTVIRKLLAKREH